MSRFRVSIAIILISAVSSAATAALPASLLAEWNFDEGAGAETADSSSNRHRGKIYGAQWAKQTEGFALSLDGFDDYVDLGESRSLGIGGPVSLEAWIRPMRRAHGESILLGEGFNSFAMTYYNGERVYWYIGGGGNGIRGPLTLDQWNHVVATFDGEQMSLWVNGERVANQESRIKTYEPAGHFLIGSRGEPGGERFKGMLDKVRAYGDAMSQAEAIAHFETEKHAYLDLTESSRLTVTPYFYVDRREMVVEADYGNLQRVEKWQNPRRLEVTLLGTLNPDQIILQRVIDAVPTRGGLANVTLPTGNLSTGDYIVRATLGSDQSSYPVEQFTFTWPMKSRPLPSAAEKVAPPLPPKRQPTSFEFEMGAGGGFTLSIEKEQYPFVSRISWPNGEFNQLTAGDTAADGESAWRVTSAQPVPPFDSTAGKQSQGPMVLAHV